MNVQPTRLNLIDVSLSAADWNIVLNCIAKQPWETVDPIMQAVRQQVLAAVHGGIPPRRGASPALSDAAGDTSFAQQPLTKE